MNILILGSVLPAPIKSKELENDVQLTTAEFHEYKYDVNYHFVFMVPYSNWFLSKFSSKWKDYYRLRKQKTYHLKGRTVYVFTNPVFRGDRYFRHILGFLSFISAKKRIEKILKEFNIDLIHSQDIKYSGLLANLISKNFDIPYIATTRGPRKSGENNYPEGVIADAKATFNLSRFDLEAAMQYNKSSFLIPHGLGSSFLEQKKIYESSHNTPLRIVTLCRLLDWKNIDKVLRALNHVDFDFVYDIYGDGPDYVRLVSITKELELSKNVHFKGFVNYELVPRTLSEYDVFVLPSYLETFGRAFFEAMACGLPVIGAKGCGVDGFITDGEEGFLVNHTNIEEIVDKLKFLNVNRNKMSEMGKNAKLLSYDFSWDSIVARIDHIYRDVLQ